ncbi:MAG: hypothetical protein K6F32_03890 [Bacilli bacterium]|nr:hypothetical protein [Bacilli bacterium]
MKFIVKALLVLAVALPTGGAVAHAITTLQAERSDVDTTYSSTRTTYTMEGGGYTFKINRKNLRFTIQKGDVVFNSGETLEDDEEITSLRAGFLESAVSIWGLNSSGGESNFAIFDGNHSAVTETKVEEMDGGLVAHITVLDGRKTDPTLSLTFDLEYRLESDGLSMALTNAVDQGSKNVLSAVALYPGFDMSYGHYDGTFLLPDGSGALIDLSTPTHAQSPFSLRTYGNDIGISTSSRSYTSSEQLAWPMYGHYDAEKAMMVTIEEGQEYSELNAKVAGMSDNYNASYFRFVLRDTTYQYLGMSESSKKPIPQSVPNSFTPRIHYHLYDETMDYNGLAKKYREYLIGKGLLAKNEGSAPKMRLEFLMGDSKKALFGKEYVRMTSSDFVREKVGDLASTRGDLVVDLKGYSAGGYENSYPNCFPVEGRLGDIGHMTSSLKQIGVDVNFRVDALRSFADSRGDLARNESQKLIATSDYVDGTGMTFYRLNPDSTSNIVASYGQQIQSLGGAGASFTSLGYDLYSTHYRSEFTRSQSIASYADTLSKFPLKAALRKPNLYALPYADSIIDAAVGSSSFVIETESVPFQSLVLSGYAPLYSPALNLYELGSSGLLRLLDYNILPSYLLTENTAMDLIDSPASSYLYSSKYDVWEEDIKESYDCVVAPLKEVAGQAFESRKKIAANVYLNEYESGAKIVINYGNSAYSYGGKEVKASSFEVFKA